MSVPPRPPDGPTPADAALRTAQEARAQVDRDPRRAAELSQIVLEETDAAEPVSVALRALGLALRELGNTRSAVRMLSRAAMVADQAGLSTRAAEARLSLVPVLVERGDTDGAQAAVDAAASTFRSGPDAARLALQQALILQLTGRIEEALAHYGTALPVLRRAGDVEYECIGLLRRGIIHARRGDHPAAERDLGRCANLARTHGYELLYAFAEHNLAYAALERGDLPRALHRLDTTLRLQTRLGQPVADVRTLRAEVLIAAGLADEAREQLTAAITEYTALGNAGPLADAEVWLADAALLGGDPGAAREAAASARAAFTRQRRPGGVALARHFQVQARWEAGERDEALLHESLGATDELAAAGWLIPAQASRFLAGRVAEALNRPTVAHALLAECARHRNRGTAYMRATAWHAEALLRLRRGDHRAASSAVRTGLRVLADNAATLGATELRVHAAGRGEDLARLGLRLALSGGRPRAVLEWSERWRAGALRTRPVVPGPDDGLLHDLAELRHVTRLIDQTAASATARPSSPSDEDPGPAWKDTRRLLLRQSRLEARVRDRARLAAGGPAHGSSLDVDDLMDALGDRALVELVQADDDLLAVTVADGRIRATPLPGADEALAESEWLRFHLHEQARGFGSQGAQDAARAGAQFAARRAGDLLLAPLSRHIGDRELVIVPTGPLHALPWPVLPACEGRPVSVAPSAGMWLRARRAPPVGSTPAVLAAGPGLDQADAEIEAVVRHVSAGPLSSEGGGTPGASPPPNAVTLTGKDASAEAVLCAMDGARLAHIAAHGRFSPGNPQLSHLELADGPLYVYDLERLARAPDLLVLSACDVGLSAVRPGDELMGLAGAVFTLGTRTLIASVVPVPDSETRRLMTEVHRRLAAGDSPGRALAAAQDHAPVPGFVCFGAG